MDRRRHGRAGRLAFKGAERPYYVWQMKEQGQGRTRRTIGFRPRQFQKNTMQRAANGNRRPGFEVVGGTKLRFEKPRMAIPTRSASP